jgi:stage V sporulation protein B
MYLAHLFGEEGMGIYQLVSPVLALSFSLAAAAYQTAISKFVAESAAKHGRASFMPLFVGLSVSIPLSFLCTGVVYIGSEYIATSLLMEPRTASMLRIIAFSIPLSSVHSCVNGFFFGIKKTAVPSATQLLEQGVRVGSVFIMSSYALAHGSELTLNVAVLGLAIGEFFSMTVSVFAIYVRYCREYRSIHNGKSGSMLMDKLGSIPRFSLGKTYRRMMGMAIPLTANRIVLNLLHSVEAVSIPTCLKLYGYDTKTALSVYGVLTGMAMPMIFFPNALTGSIAVLLLPVISESYALGDMKAVKKTIKRTITYCSLMGLVCMSGFLLLGRWLGTVLFNSDMAGHFIITLSFICPFMYLDTTLSSILQGLDMTVKLFIMNVICLVIRLGFIFLTVPKVGITGYLWGILVSQIALTVMYLLCLYLYRVKRRKTT